MTTLPFAAVTTEDQLNQDMMAIAGGTANYTIAIASDFTLTTDLLAVNLGTGGALTLQGNGHTIDGAQNISARNSITVGLVQTHIVVEGQPSAYATTCLTNRGIGL